MLKGIPVAINSISRVVYSKFWALESVCFIPFRSWNPKTWDLASGILDSQEFVDDGSKGWRRKTDQVDLKRMWNRKETIICIVWLSSLHKKKMGERVHREYSIENTNSICVLQTRKSASKQEFLINKHFKNLFRL